MTYRGNQPLLAAAMSPYSVVATDKQGYVPIPGGVVPGLNIVGVGGALLSPGDFDDSDGLGIALAVPMAAGTQFQLYALSLNTSYVPVQGPLAGFRNLLINADGRVNQRQYASGAATTAANQYTVDRWRVVTSGQSLAYALTANGYTFTAPAGGVEQVIEGNNIVGGAYVLNWTGTATATVNGVAVPKRGTFTLSANTNATVRFSGGTLYQPQLELGNVATLFEQRPLGVETSLCQRYFVADVTNVVLSCYAPGYACASPVFFPTQMRVAPTVVASPSAFYAIGFTAQYAINPTTKFFTYYFTSPGTPGNAGLGTLTWTATAEL